jgi:predicted DNA-binding transcriptional regulator AlpA
MMQNYARVTVPLPQAPAVLGLSRSAIYRAAAQGKITLRKLGRTTLVDVASARAFIESLPKAEIRRAA